MATPMLPEHLILKRIRSATPDELVEVSVSLWEQLATELISLIGESGFDALYARSIHQTQLKCPWLDAGPHSAARFTELRASLSRNTCYEARTASLVLAENFIRIMTSLIGEHLTASLLRTAWAEISDTEPKDPL